jgi:hypothetical protein
MALSHEPASTSDLGFFRNTGFALVVATLVAGAITLSLTVKESRSIQTASKEAQTKEPAEIVTADVTGSIQTASQE